MPSHEEHCKHSLRRYNKTFSDLHKWMDEPSTLWGPSHRRVRHDRDRTPSQARELFGKFADQASLDHIRLDELATRRKSKSHGLWYSLTDFDPEGQMVSFKVEAGESEPIHFEDLPFFEDISLQKRRTVRFGPKSNWKETEQSMAEMIEAKFGRYIHRARGKDIVNRLRDKVKKEVYGAAYPKQ